MSIALRMNPANEGGYDATVLLQTLPVDSLVLQGSDWAFDQASLSQAGDRRPDQVLCQVLRGKRDCPPNASDSDSEL
jgi:hypothetical protein